MKTTIRPNGGTFRQDNVAEHLEAMAQGARDNFARFGGICTGLRAPTCQEAFDHYRRTVRGYAKSLADSHAKLQEAIGLYLADLSIEDDSDGKTTAAVVRKSANRGGKTDAQ